MTKRLFDISLSALGLAVLLPFLAIFALMVWLEDFGAPIFVQRRIGEGGKPFSMYKLRSMRAAAAGSAITVGRDARITRIGHLLRKIKMDELPQLVNVLLGEMSFVGPRPEVEKYVALYTPEQRKVLKLKPGITDPASLALFDEAELLSRVNDPEDFYIRELMPEKIRINMEYGTRASLLRDLLVILATIARPFGIRFDVFRTLGLSPVRIGVKL